MAELIDVNCPFNQRTSKGTSPYKKCNRICVRVYPGSAGEVWCRTCRLPFCFEVGSQSTQPKISLEFKKWQT